MFKLFSVQEANTMIPVVEGFFDTMQRAVADSLRLREELKGVKPNSVEARNKAQELAFVLNDAYQTKAQLDRLGVFIQDVDQGIVDFPSQLGAEVIYLSWEKGQDAITHYHRLSSGDRLPLPEEARDGSGALA